MVKIRYTESGAQVGDNRLPPKPAAILKTALRLRDEALPLGKLADDLWTGFPPSEWQATIRVYASTVNRVLRAIEHRKRVSICNGYLRMVSVENFRRAA